MTDDHIWTTVSARACTLFGDTPGRHQEADIIDAWQQAPLHVERKIEEIGALVATGTIRSGWAVLHKAAHDQPLEVTASPGNELAKAEKRALAWINNAGCHIDRQTELEDALYGNHGDLRHYADNQPLRQRMLAAWKAIRPYAENADHDAETRAQRWVAAIERRQTDKAARLTEATT